MTPVAYGYATPITLAELQPGMLLSAQLASGERTVGLVHDSDHDRFLIVLLSNQERAVPVSVDIGELRGSIGWVNGRLELEPREPGQIFVPPSRLGASAGYAIGPDGEVGVAVDVEHWGRQIRSLVDLSTGMAMQSRSGVTALLDPKLFIAQEGRKERFELPKQLP